MTELIAVPKANEWTRLKALVLDSVSSPITRRVYNLGLNEFFAWYGREPRPGFTKATVAAWRVALELRGLGAISINVRITAVRKLAVEAADNGLLPLEIATGINANQGRSSAGRTPRKLALRQAGTDFAELSRRDYQKGSPGSRNPRGTIGMRSAKVGSGRSHDESHPATGWPVVHRGPGREAWQGADGAYADVD